MMIRVAKPNPLKNLKTVKNQKEKPLKTLKTGQF
jgi:hypothetical protein